MVSNRLCCVLPRLCAPSVQSAGSLLTELCNQSGVEESTEDTRNLVDDLQPGSMQAVCTRLETTDLTQPYVYICYTLLFCALRKESTMPQVGCWSDGAKATCRAEHKALAPTLRPCDAANAFCDRISEGPTSCDESCSLLHRSPNFWRR